MAAVAISSACWSSGAREPDGPRLTPASTTVDEKDNTCMVPAEGVSPVVIILGAAVGLGDGKVVTIEIVDGSGVGS